MTVARTTKQLRSLSFSKQSILTEIRKSKRQKTWVAGTAASRGGGIQCNLLLKIATNAVEARSVGPRRLESRSGKISRMSLKPGVGTCMRCSLDAHARSPVVAICSEDTVTTQMQRPLRRSDCGHCPDDIVSFGPPSVLESLKHTPACAFLSQPLFSLVALANFSVLFFSSTPTL